MGNRVDTADSTLYYGMIWRGALAGVSAYAMTALPPYPAPRWGLIALATAVLIALGIALLVGWRATQAGELTDTELVVQNVLANAAAGIAMWAAGTDQGTLMPLLFVIIIYNSAFRTGWLIVLAWFNGTVACLAGLLLAGLPTWQAITSTVVFAACAAAIQASVAYLTRRVRQLAAGLETEREIASLAAQAVDRDSAFTAMLPRSAALLGVRTFAVVRIDEDGPGIVAAVRDGVADEVAVTDVDLDGGAPIGLHPGEMLTLCTGRGETADPEALAAVRDLFVPVVERSRYLTGLRHQAQSDGLTGLANRRHLDDVLRALVAADRRFAVIILDLDLFKAHNDAHGHLAGDDVLVRAAEILRSVTRSGDLAARYGGEEFCVVILDEDIQGAAAIEGRLRQAWERSGMPVTYSAGIAVGARGEEVQQILRRADEALYRAKESGRRLTVRAD